MLAFIAIAVWVFVIKKKEDFDEQANLPLDEEDKEKGRTRRSHHERFLALVCRHHHPGLHRSHGLAVHRHRPRQGALGHQQEGEETTGHVWDEDLTELNNPMPRWWLWLFYGTVIWSLIYLVLYPGLGNYAGRAGLDLRGPIPGRAERATPSSRSASANCSQLPLEELAEHPDALRMGRNIFAHNCSTCHGADARGALARLSQPDRRPLDLGW
jgi:hypothetical protein